MDSTIWNLPDGAVLRSLSSDEDYEQCLELQRRTWGDDFREQVPPTILAISQKVGGVAAGAFDGDRMLGFVYGLTGIRHGRIAHWSHMLAVHREARGRGLGRQLKFYQRSLLLQLGVEVMYWTYDPLVARNANLNLNRLAALPVEYVRDMYGSDTGSELHSALGTDRFVVAWELAAPAVVERCREGWESGTAEHPSPAEVLAGVVNVDAEGRPRTGLEVADDTELVWVEAPADIEACKRSDMDEARRWRASTREAILGLLEAGYRIVAVDRAAPEADVPPRWFYRLERGPEVGTLEKERHR